MRLLDQYKEMHKQGKFSGWSLEKHLEDIAKLLEQYECESVLDYGCGKAKYHPEGWDKYEPALEEYSELPNKIYDAVICTDVLEHVPEDELDEVLKNIFTRSTKLVFLSISTRLAKKSLPNGENAHCTVKEPIWWNEKLSQYKTNQTLVVSYA